MNSFYRIMIKHHLEKINDIINRKDCDVEDGVKTRIFNSLKDINDIISVKRND